MLHFMTYEFRYEFMYVKNIMKSYLKSWVPKFQMKSDYAVVGQGQLYMHMPRFTRLGISSLSTFYGVKLEQQGLSILNIKLEP